ncbi:MAG: FecR domain-containing protein [Prevotellaceae bacterium]|jgi:ferric-dicitrate binding protein FerR (iron transport regulator)|nr:FecR domain-containing protein [Prevotellaceae bacterium]
MSKTRRILQRYFNRYTCSKVIRNNFLDWFVNHRHIDERDLALWELWDNLEVAPQQTTERSFSQVERLISMRNKSFHTVPFLQKIRRIAAALLLPLVSASAVYFYTKHTNNTVAGSELMECFVPNGKIQMVTLPDSSQVLLNAGTVLIYPSSFSTHTRTVYLNGEACFTVSRDKNKPFIVKTIDMDIEVLGTVFDVSSYADSEQALATLKSGRVNVHLKNELSTSVILEPREQISYNRASGEVKVTRQVNVENVFAWKDGHLVIQGMSMNEIVNTIERRYGVTIYLNANKYEKERITAKFMHGETVYEFLSVLQQLIPGLKYKTADGKIYIY